MTRDDIIAMVQEVIVTDSNDNPFDFRLTTIEQIERFAGLVAAAQRQWVGLTDEQINQYDPEYRDILYDVEKMLKENNT